MPLLVKITSEDNELEQSMAKSWKNSFVQDISDETYNKHWVKPSSGLSKFTSK